MLVYTNLSPECRGPLGICCIVMLTFHGRGVDENTHLAVVAFFTAVSPQFALLTMELPLQAT